MHEVYDLENIINSWDAIYLSKEKRKIFSIGGRGVKGVRIPKMVEVSEDWKGIPRTSKAQSFMWAKKH